MRGSARKSERAGTGTLGRAAFVLLAALAVNTPLPSGADEAQLRRGAYLFDAAGCLGCHTDSRNKGARLAGGRALKTPFGTFYGPNITPDPEQGLGNWTKEDFRRALREGISPTNKPYYPAFPYTSFTKMTDADIDDLWAYLRSLPASSRANKPHDLSFPFNLRMLLRPWRGLFFEQGPYQPEPDRDKSWNRGAYLVHALGHCGECHSPRGLLGQVDSSRALAGNPQGPDNEQVPGIAPGENGGIGKWSPDDIVAYLSLGMSPDGDFAGGAMAEVVENTTQKLTDADQQAIARYLKDTSPRPGDLAAR